MLMRAAVLCLTLLVAGCQRPSPQTPSARGNCPLAAEVEALHAVSFWLEHGEFTAAEAEATHLLSQSHPLDKEVYAWGTKLQNAARRAANEPAEAKRCAEEARAWMAAWSCFSESQHQEAHRRLPRF